MDPLLNESSIRSFVQSLGHPDSISELADSVQESAHVFSYLGFDPQETQMDFMKRAKVLKKSAAEAKSDLVKLVTYLMVRGSNFQNHLSRGRISEKGAKEMENLTKAYKILPNVGSKKGSETITLPRLAGAFPSISFQIVQITGARVRIPGLPLNITPHMKQPYFGCLIPNLRDNDSLLQLQVSYFIVQIILGKTFKSSTNDLVVLAQFLTNAMNSEVIDNQTKFELLEKTGLWKDDTLTADGLDWCNQICQDCKSLTGFTLEDVTSALDLATSGS